MAALCTGPGPIDVEFLIFFPALARLVILTYGPVNDVKDCGQKAHKGQIFQQTHHCVSDTLIDVGVQVRLKTLKLKSKEIVMMSQQFNVT